jgi:hypothetical protein
MQPETIEVSGCVSQPRDRGSNPRTGTKKGPERLSLSRLGQGNPLRGSFSLLPLHLTPTNTLIGGGTNNRIIEVD